METWRFFDRERGLVVFEYADDRGVLSWDAYLLAAFVAARKAGLSRWESFDSAVDTTIYS